MQEVADGLDRELSRHLRVLSRRSMTAEQLHRAEPEHDRILLVAPDPARRWHSFALRQADRTVVVASTASPPPPAVAGRPGGSCLAVAAGPLPAGPDR